LVREGERPNTPRPVSDPHVQQTPQHRRGSFLTQTRLQPSEFGDHRESRRHTHSTSDSRGLDGRQVRAGTFADEPGDLPRTTPSRQRRRVRRNPPSRRPSLRRRDLATRLSLTNDRHPSTARDRRESVELTQQGPQLGALDLPQRRHQLSDSPRRSTNLSPARCRVTSRFDAVHNPDANSDHRQTPHPKRPLPQPNPSQTGNDPHHPFLTSWPCPWGRLAARSGMAKGRLADDSKVVPRGRLKAHGTRPGTSLGLGRRGAE
jgi:hypothetical protein